GKYAISLVRQIFELDEPFKEISETEIEDLYLKIEEKSQSQENSSKNTDPKRILIQ
ncbi:MAG: glutamyl-tRNA reductase, partial [Thermodesulfobacterium geofontis]